VPDLATLQQALHRAVERHNMTRFTPAGRARKLVITELVITELRRVIEAIAEGNTTKPQPSSTRYSPSRQIPPPPPSPAASAPPWVCSTTGSSAATRKHPKISVNVHLPAGHWLGERAATDILVLAANDAPSAHSTH
jgi:hypothetical protein